MPAPTFIQEAETAWNNDTTPKGSGNFTTSTGDVVVACVVSENATISNLDCVGTNVSLSLAQEVDIVDYCELIVKAGVVSSGGTTSVSFTNTGSTSLFGGNALTFSNSDGIGASAKANVDGSAPSLNITTTQANSAIVMAVGDWNAVDGASPTWRQVNSSDPTSVTYFRDAAHYTVYIAYYADAGAVGTKTVGMSAPGGQRYSIIALEIKGTAGGGPLLPHARDFAPDVQQLFHNPR